MKQQLWLETIEWPVNVRRNVMDKRNLILADHLRKFRPVFGEGFRVLYGLCSSF